MGKPKVGNTKAAIANARKAEAKAEKDAKQAQAKEEKEAAEWAKGAKKPGKAEEREAKRAEQLAKKAELEALKRKEEEELAKLRPKQSGDDKKAAKKAAKLEMAGASRGTLTMGAVELSASNIDDALDLFAAVDDSASSLNSKVGVIDNHPERRARAAYAAYEQRRLPILKEANKDLRLTQLKQLLWKEWQKSPENPFNQAHIAYNATRKEKADLVEASRREIESRLKI
ncbi:hypothetical protein L0F63_002050 [Massospora cicadina]|nr:hypothetical protein L0F63_002050 [Massospora cicadina]